MNRQYLHSATADEGILFSQAEVWSFQVSKLITELCKDLYLLHNILLKVKQALQNLISI